MLGISGALAAVGPVLDELELHAASTDASSAAAAAPDASADHGRRECGPFIALLLSVVLEHDREPVRDPGRAGYLKPGYLKPGYLKHCAPLLGRLAWLGLLAWLGWPIIAIARLRE
jgi:hypothetical protein